MSQSGHNAAVHGIGIVESATCGNMASSNTSTEKMNGGPHRGAKRWPCGSRPVSATYSTRSMYGKNEVDAYSRL